jgi:glutathione S-transferase
MRLKLYVVHGSHPCAAVEKALSLKGLEYSVFEWPPPTQAAGQRVIFGGRTVPGLRIDGSEKVQGSRAILRRLDQLAPEPPLLPSDPADRERVEEAERWGDEVFQPVARELVWAGMLTSPAAMVSYSEHSQLRLPAPAVKLSAPLVARLSARLNQTNADVARRDLQTLPTQLDKIDGWIVDGRIGDPERPNAADLQIFSTVRLLMTLEDARPLVDSRPCARPALGLFPQIDGRMPAGSLRA